MRFAPHKNVQSGRAARGSRVAAAVFLFLFSTLVWLLPTAQHAQTRPDAPARPAQRVATLADYRSRVRDAAVVLEELAATYQRAKDSERTEVWSKEGFNSDFIVELPDTEKTAFAKVRGL